MTKDEALKLALEALEANHFLIHGSETKGGLAFCMDGYYSGCFDIDSNDKQTNKAITAIKEALAQPEQKPVPVKRMMGWVEGLKRQSDNGRYMHIPSGLNSGTCWELANELEQFINTTPPQRTWVGLTEKDICEAAVKSQEGISPRDDTLRFAIAIEAKLKEKNSNL